MRPPRRGQRAALARPRRAVTRAVLHTAAAQARRHDAAPEAVDMARRLGDDDALAFALACRHTAISDPGHLDARLTVSTELVEVGERAGNPELALHRARPPGLRPPRALARRRGARRSRPGRGSSSRSSGQPMQRYFVIWLQSTLALLEGRFDDAERLSNEAFDIGIAADHPDAFVVYGTQAVFSGGSAATRPTSSSRRGSCSTSSPTWRPGPRRSRWWWRWRGCTTRQREKLLALTGRSRRARLRRDLGGGADRADRGVPHRRRPRSAPLRSTSGSSPLRRRSASSASACPRWAR